VKSLRVYGAEHVVNDATVLLVSRAFKNDNVEDLAPWPGTSFSAESAEGKALIGEWFVHSPLSLSMQLHTLSS